MLLTRDPRALFELGALPAAARVPAASGVLIVSALLVLAQFVGLFGWSARGRGRVLGLTAGWWVFIGVDSVLSDWRTPIWAAELCLVWLVMRCMLADAREEARQFRFVAGGG